MSTIAAIQSLQVTATRRTCWLCALFAPMILAVAWCTSMHWLPANLGTVNGLVLLILLGACTATDLHSRRIYNWATYSAIYWAIGLNIVGLTYGDAMTSRLGVQGLASCLQGAVGCFVLMLFAYSLARGGAGDVKLATALGALIGFEQGVWAIGVSYIFAGASVLLWSVWRQGPFTLAVAMVRLLGSMLLPTRISRPDEREKDLLRTPIPLAGFFAVGTLSVVLGFVGP